MSSNIFMETLSPSGDIPAVLALHATEAPQQLLRHRQASFKQAYSYTEMYTNIEI